MFWWEKEFQKLATGFKEEIGDADNILPDKLIFHEHQLIFQHFTPISFYMTISSQKDTVFFYFKINLGNSCNFLRTNQHAPCVEVRYSRHC